MAESDTDEKEGKEGKLCGGRRRQVVMMDAVSVERMQRAGNGQNRGMGMSNGVTGEGMGESVSFLFDKKWSVSMNNEVAFFLG